jgi:peptide/nickel transport system substrate-binding protein
MRKPTLSATIATFFLVVLVSALPQTASLISASHTPAGINPTTLQTEGNETTPKYGGTLRVASLLSRYSFQDLNPLLNILTYCYAGSYPIYSSLVRCNETGLMEPDLAVDWETSEDGLNWTFDLRSDVEWHDEETLTAQDVEFTFDKLMNGTEVDPRWAEYVSAIRSVEALNDTTVFFSLEHRYNLLAYLDRMPIIAKHVFEPYGGSLSAYDGPPVGTGPFKFSYWSPGTNMTLVAHENYFRGRPYLDSVFYRWDIPVEDFAARVEDNSVDIAGNFYEMINPSIMATLEQVPGVSVLSSERLAYRIMSINLDNAILSSLNVRKALAYAINKTKIIENVYIGYATPSTGPIPPCLSYWYNPNVTNYEYDPAKACTILDEAGYPVKSETGFRFNLTLKVGDWDPYRINATKMIRDFLNNINISVTYIEEPRGQFWGDLETHNFELAVLAAVFMVDPDILFIYHAGNYYNYGNYSNAEVDKCLEFGQNSSDIEQSRGNYSRVQEIIAEELPDIPLLHDGRLSVYHNDFHGFISKPAISPIDSCVLEKVWYDPTLSGQGKSPVKICFVDPQGRRTGFFNGSIVEEIPGSSYDEEYNAVKIRSPPETSVIVRNPNDPYLQTTTILPSYFVVEVTGTDAGHYRLELVNVALEYKSVVIVEDDTYAGKVDRYWLVMWQNGMIYQNYGPPYRQRTIGMGYQLVIPPQGVDPRSYNRQGGTILPD